MAIHHHTICLNCKRNSCGYAKNICGIFANFLFLFRIIEQSTKQLFTLNNKEQFVKCLQDACKKKQIDYWQESSIIAKLLNI